MRNTLSKSLGAGRREAYVSLPFGAKDQRERGSGWQVARRHGWDGVSIVRERERGRLSGEMQMPNEAGSGRRRGGDGVVSAASGKPSKSRSDHALIFTMHP